MKNIKFTRAFFRNRSSSCHFSNHFVPLGRAKTAHRLQSANHKFSRLFHSFSHTSQIEKEAKITRSIGMYI